MIKYPSLKRAKLDKDFLKSIGSNYSFIFGALGELVDNSRDAGAKNLHIFSEKSKFLENTNYADFMLYFVDDGCGMSPGEAEDVIVFGSSKKKGEKLGDFVGQYGTGLKSGSMRIAQDFILFTKKDSIFTVTMMSRSFYDDQNITEIIVPIPSFINKRGDLDTYIPPGSNSNEINDKQKQELSVIFKYSPFKSMDDLKREFDRIQKNGTIVVLYNIFKEEKRTGWRPLLDVISYKEDIIIDKDALNGDIDYKIPEECKSFRAYLEIIYSNPKMKIYVQNVKVKTKYWEHCLYLPCQYRHVTKSVFNDKAKSELKIAEEKSQNAQFKLNNANSVLESYKQDLNGRDRLQKEIILEKQKDIEIIRRELEECKKEVEEKKANLNSYVVLNFKFGINLNNRSQDGFFFYNQHRLMIMHDKSSKSNQTKPEYSGIVGIVDIPYSVMAPSQNKQGFIAENELKKLKQLMLQHMEDYYFEFRNEIKRIKQYEDIDKFWDDMGYVNYDVDKPFDNDPIYAKRRFDRIKPYIQCDKCLKFRRVPNRPSDVGKIWPDDTICSHFPNENCNKPEQIVNFKELTFNKRVYKDAPTAPINNQRQSSVPPSPSPQIASRLNSVTSIYNNNEQTPNLIIPSRIKRSASDLENETLINELDEPIQRENSYQALNTSPHQENTVTKPTTFAAKRVRVQRPANDSEDDPEDRSYRPGQLATSQKKKKTQTASNKQKKSGNFEIEIDYEDDRANKLMQLPNKPKFRMKTDNYNKDEILLNFTDKLVKMIKTFLPNQPEMKSLDDIFELDLDEAIDSLKSNN